jgi:uncharacterized sulfatase
VHPSAHTAIQFGFIAFAAWVVAMAAVAAPAAEATAGAQDPHGPNVVLVIGDDHGWPYYGFMESPQTFLTTDGPVPAHAVAPTPNLDALAARGVVFTRGYSTASLCRPALQTLLSASGLHAVQWHERRRHLAGERTLGKQGDSSAARFFRTLPRELQRYGYLTWTGGKMWEGKPAHAGFTHHAADPISQAVDGRLFGREGWNTATCGSTGDPSVPCPALDPLRAFLDEAGSRPFFAWVAPGLPHVPYDAPHEYRTPFEQLGMNKAEANHLANIRWFDELFGEIAREIDSRGLRENTLLIYVADNGWGINMQSHARLGRGKGTPYDIGFRTPVIFAGPPALVAARHDDLILTSDVVATILGHVPGARIPGDSVGVNLRPRLEGGPPMGRSSIITHGSGDAVLDPPWRYLRHPNGREELYRIDEDPLESHDLSAEHPDLIQSLRQRADQHLVELLQPSDAGEVLGRVITPFSEPLAGVQLEYGDGPTAQVVSTDAGGWFVLSPKLPPAAPVRSNRRLAAAFWKDRPVVPPLSLNHGVLFEIIGTLRPPPLAKPMMAPVGARIVVRLVDESSGAPVANAHVRARSRDPMFSLRTYTNGDGYAWIEGLPVSRYRLTIKSIGHRHVEQSEVVVDSPNDLVQLSLAAQWRPRNARRAASNATRYRGSSAAR